jgi:hypothetical protein
MGQKLIELADGMVGDAREQVAEPGERIDLHQLAGSDKAAEHCRGLAAVIAAEERPLLRPDRDTADRARWCWRGGARASGQK